MGKPLARLIKKKKRRNNNFRNKMAYQGYHYRHYRFQKDSKGIQ